MIYMGIGKKHPLRFIVFLVLVAGLFLYIIAQWQGFPGQSRETAVPANLGEEGVSGGDEVTQPAVVVDSETEPEESAGGDYFAAARMKRQQALSRQQELLRSLVESSDADEDMRQQAQERLLQLTERHGLATELENLIRGKGFEDAIVYLGSEGAIVVVNTGELSRSDVAQIADLLERYASIAMDEVSVMARTD